MEIWKDIPGWENRYQVSSLGKIRSLNFKQTGKIKIMSGVTDIRGYKSIAFRPNGRKSKQKHYMIHRLVAEVFIPNPDDKPFVNHKNGKREDNRVDNLEWVTRSENERHKIYILNKKSGTLIPPKPVRCIETGEIFPSQTEAAKKNGVTQGAISAALCGKTKTSAGYRWEFI